MMAAPLEQRFWSKVDQRDPNECWPWTGYRNHKGYGRIAIGGGQHRPAHRVAWEMAYEQPFPADKLACHSCDNPPCCNPSHIWPGTDAENSRDSASKGRHWAYSYTHCKRGHQLSGDNVHISTKGHRSCRACRPIWKRNGRLRREQQGA